MRKFVSAGGGFIVLAIIAVGGWGDPAQRRGGPSGVPARGQEIFAVQKCSLCHTVGKTGGKLGPDLSGVGTKRTAAWLTTYLPNPQAKDPKNKMPPATVKGQDLTDLVAYLMSLKK